jgi:V8-like Glu-specific endopeptidase
MMKKAILFLLIFPSFVSFAQISTEGKPYSWQFREFKSLVSIPSYHLNKLDITRLSQEDSIFPTPYRYSFFTDVSINIKDGIETHNESEKGNIWQYKISAEEAYSIQVAFKTFRIPPQAKLFIYTEDYSKIYGAFTEQNNQDDSLFTVADFPGNNLILEYFEPDNALFKGNLIIGSLGQAYRDLFSQKANVEIATSYIDINCNEGNEWQNEKHAICKISFRQGSSGYLCSGALLNNTRIDGTPYFLTANHCISDSVVAKTLIAYFNYENISCNGSLGNFRTLTGASLMTTGPQSDYTLLKLKSNPPTNYMPYYAGWDITNTAGDKNVCIHHPEGFAKKISVDYDLIKSHEHVIAWDQGNASPVSSHWQVSFDAGITGEGSSGAPLFNKNKRVIGQLHGGDDTYKYYGKFSYSWNNNASNYKKLYKYLDPDSTGVKILDGYAPASNPPDAHFSTQFTRVCLSSPVNFYQSSAFNPTTQKWTITPGTYNFLSGTNENSKDPIVEFTASGDYAIKLKVTNAHGNDSIRISNAVTAGASIQLDMVVRPSTEVCYCNLDSLTLEASGANTYTWSIMNQPVNPFVFTSIQNTKTVIKQDKAISIDSTYTLRIKMIGKQGQCSDTIDQTISIVKQPNDDIENAIPLTLGTSPDYSNKCATIQSNEPIPPYGNCTGITSWCDEYDDGSKIVEHSVWFKFTGPSTGIAGLKCLGFDSEIAIYKADSYLDILKGIYTLLAANDDETAVNSYSTIPEVTVSSGITYWIQVDGSGGGAVGTFNLKLSDNNITGVKTISNNLSLSLFPQPARDILYVKSENLLSKRIKYGIYNLSGKLLQTKQVDNFENNILGLDISDFATGLYIIKIETDKGLITQKFVKE